MKRIAEVLAAPLVVGLLLLLLAEPVRRWTTPVDTATVTTFDTGVRLSAAKLRGIADQVAPRADPASGVPGTNPSDYPTMIDLAGDASGSASTSITPNPSPSSSPLPDPAANEDRLAIYVVDVRNDGSTTIGGKRFNLALAPVGAGQPSGTIYRAGNAPDSGIYDRRNQGIHIWPDFKSAWISVPRLEPGQHFSAWTIGEADKTLVATPRVDGLAIRPTSMTRERLFAPANDLRTTLSANRIAIGISFALALILAAAAWWGLTRFRRPA